MNIDSGTAAVVAGLITSLHCLGMCGPLACTVVPVRGDRADALVAGSAYHLARLAGYAALGAVFGALGHAPAAWLGSGLVRYGPWLLVAFFVALALRLDRSLPRLPAVGAVFRRVHAWARGRPPAVAAAMLGGATPLLPCGPLYLLVAAATLTGSAVRGAGFLLAFGLGTVPLLWLLQTNFGWIRLKLAPAWLARVQTGLALVAAVAIAWRLRATLGLPGPAIDHFDCH